MLAVVMFHAALPYACRELSGLLWTVRVAGDEHGVLADPLFWTAEAVIMPLFFGMSGFWSARAGARGTVAAFVMGRVRRMGVPLALGCITIGAASLAIWVIAMPLTGRLSWEDARRLDLPRHMSDQLWGTAHLWYLQYVLLWALFQVPLDAVVAAADRGEYPVVARALNWLDKTMRSPRRWLLPTVGLTLLLAVEPDVYLGFPHGWFPHAEKFLHSGVCFLFGWLCWRNRSALAAAGPAAARPLALAASLAAFPLYLAVQFSALGGGGDRLPILPAGLCAGLAITAALIYGASSRRPTGRLVATLAGASFWVYLVHQPIVGALHLGLKFVDMPADLKFLSVLCVAIGLSMATEPVSRRTRLGRLLTGRNEPTLPPATIRFPVARPDDQPEDRPVRRAA
ncbi:hypothetical protein LzC2_28310 [Planctomycetes bacterium LzC2]|uniref:Acyltransferase 3 domain-containing protein n=2 Tax=Alienimonas chondri TaxID=2681879 RepID=A0ABX1VF83_9PLAN|nr:hypothetical protein [Alienimonas chondri]